MIPGQEIPIRRGVTHLGREAEKLRDRHAEQLAETDDHIRIRALIDVKMKTSAMRGRDGRDARLYAELQVNMDTEKTIVTIGECGPLEEIPQRNYWQMDEYMRPIMTTALLEKEAEKLLLRFCPNALTDENEADPRELARRMGLKLLWKPLYGENQTKSTLFFREDMVKVQDFIAGPPFEEREPYETTIAAGTIVINTRAKGSVFDRIFHECIHYAWHYMFFRLQEMHNSEIEKLKFTKRQVRINQKVNDPLRWIEFQANRGAEIMRLPGSKMEPIIRKRENELRNNGKHAGYRYQQIGEELAAELNLAEFRIRKRLTHLGRKAAYGAMNEVDGKQIEPFAFNTGNMESKTTFVIGKEELVREYIRNAEFRKLMDSGRYVMADGHVCLADPAFVQKGPLGLKLTEWANGHVDQCCMRFKTVFEPVGLSKYRFGRLNCDQQYNRRHAEADPAGYAGLTVEAIRKTAEFVKELQGSFPEVLTKVMTKLNITEEQLAEEMNGSVRNICRLRTEEKENYTAEQVFCICNALHLEPAVSEVMFEKAGIRLRNENEKHLLYKALLSSCYLDPLAQNLAFISAWEEKKRTGNAKKNVTAEKR